MKIELNKRISLFAGISLVLISCLLAGVVIGYELWSNPVTTEKSEAEWKGAITVIELPQRIEVKGINQDIVVSVSSKTKVEDKEGNPLTLGSLKEGDVILVAGEYQTTGNMTSDWMVKIEASKIILLGQCAKEGEIRGELECCPGLTSSVSCSGDSCYCLNCGDGVCTELERANNYCPSDCAGVGERIEARINPDENSVEVVGTRVTFDAEIYPSPRGETGEKIKIVTSAETGYFIKVDKEKITMTQEEYVKTLRSPSVMKWLEVEGIRRSGETIEAVNLYKLVQ
jgi:hypothetical protein